MTDAECEALEAAVRELDKLYPPLKCPTYYPISDVPGSRLYTVFQEDNRMNMIRYAGLGNLNHLRYWQINSGIPRGHLEAVIALVVDRNPRR